MTRTYAARRLLEHGPLTYGEFMTITGWSFRTVSSAIRRLQEKRIVTIKNINGRRHYALA